MHQKELVDAFDENKKNEGKQIWTGRGGSDGDNADCRASAPAGGHPAMDADEASVVPAAAAAGEAAPRPVVSAAAAAEAAANAAWTRRHLNQRHLDWPGLDSAPPETSPPGLGAAGVNAAWTLPYLDSAPPETTPLRQRLDSTPPGFGTRDSALLGLGAGRLPVNFDFAAALSRLCLDSDLVTPESTPLRLGAAWTRHRLSLRCRASAQR